MVHVWRYSGNIPNNIDLFCSLWLWCSLLERIFLDDLLFLASSDDQVPKGVSNLFPGLLVGHDGVARCPPSSASTAVALFRCFLLEESGTDLFVKHPDNRLDNVCLVFSGGRVDIPLEVHLDGNSEASVPDVVVGAAVASADNIVWSGFGDLVAVQRTIHVVVVAGDGIRDVVVVEKTIEVVSVHNVNAGVDDGGSGGLHRVVRVSGVVTNHATVAHGYSSRRVEVRQRLCHRGHHGVVHAVRGGSHVGRLEETLVDAEVIRRKHSARGGRIFQRDLHVHCSV